MIKLRNEQSAVSPYALPLLVVVIVICYDMYVQTVPYSRDYHRKYDNFRKQLQSTKPVILFLIAIVEILTLHCSLISLDNLNFQYEGTTYLKIHIAVSWECRIKRGIS